jgi:hypothetical protein
VTQPEALFAVLQFALEAGDLWPIAVLVVDYDDCLHMRRRTRTSLATRIPPKDVEVVALSLQQLGADAESASGRAMLARLEDQLSNTIRISERRLIGTTNIEKTLSELYDQYVASTD